MTDEPQIRPVWDANWELRQALRQIESLVADRERLLDVLQWARDGLGSLDLVGHGAPEFLRRLESAGISSSPSGDELDTSYKDAT